MRINPQGLTDLLVRLDVRYGGERYEKRDMQLRVRQQFDALQKLDSGRVPWHIVDAAQSVEQVHKELLRIVQETTEKVNNGRPLGKMWQDGFVSLSMKDE